MDKQGCDCKFNTATEQAIHDIQNTIIGMSKEVQELRWWDLRRKWVGYGMLEAFSLVLQLLTGLQRKYNNRHGELN